MSTRLISTRKKDRITPPGHVVSREPQKVFLGPAGGTTIVCPSCARARHIKVPDKYLYKRIQIKCNCKQRFPVIIDKRLFYRKEVSLSGEYWNSHSKKDYMTITSISKAGIGFETTHKPFLLAGDIVRVRFMLDDNRQTWIDEMVKVMRVDGCNVGAQFSRLGDHEQKAIGFYLM